MAGRCAVLPPVATGCEVYKAMVENLDSEIGYVLDTVQSLGIEHNTLVIFTSDNGGERYSHVWPFTGAKGSLNEGGIRVPAIAHWPGVVQRGTSSQVAITMDWTATLLAAAGVSPDPDHPLDGENLLPILRGEQPPHTRELIWRIGRLAAVRSGDLKYLRNGTAESLFDLSKDEHEQANLAGLRPAELGALRDRYEDWNAEMLPQA